MKKLTVLAHSSDADAIVRRMLHLKCVEIQRSMPEAGELSLERIESDGRQTEIKERIACIEAAMPHLAKYSTRRGGIGRRIQRLDRAAFVADGRAERAYLGLMYVTITPESARTYNLDVYSGAYVYNSNSRTSAIVAGGPADKAGIKDRDIITKIGGVPLGSSGTISSLIGEYKAGDSVEVEFIRDGQTQTTIVTLGAYSE